MSARWFPTDDELDLHARTDAPELAGDRAEQLRTKLLAAQREVPQLSRRSATPWIAGGALAVAAAAALILWLGRGGEADPVARAPKQVIESIGPARFESLNEWPDFVMRLDDGRVSITVAHLEPVERFRVKTADAEVEVRGTQFVVQVDSGRLVSVVVERGWVELRRVGEPAIDVRAGAHWDRVHTATTGKSAEPTKVASPTVDATNTADPAKRLPATIESTKPATPKIASTKPESTKPAPTRIESRKPESSKSATARVSSTKPEPTIAPTKPEPTKAESSKPDAQPAVVPPAPGEADFRAGWGALRGGNVTEAVKRFVTSCAVASGAVAEDACFWAAAASKRAGRSDTKNLLEQFLRRFPSSGRVGEAAALLGWTLYEAGDLGGAEAQFRRAVGDRVPQVRDSAQRGLTAIERRRAKP